MGEFEKRPNCVSNGRVQRQKLKFRGTTSTWVTYDKLQYDKWPQRFLTHDMTYDREIDKLRYNTSSETTQNYWRGACVHDISSPAEKTSRHKVVWGQDPHTLSPYLAISGFKDMTLEETADLILCLDNQWLCMEKAGTVRVILSRRAVKICRRPMVVNRWPLRIPDDLDEKRGG